jgi:predicted NUDIX family phosphoesterase
MPLVAEEQVLVVPTELFHSLGHFQGFSSEVDRYLKPILASGQLSYRPRGEMEADPSFKQLIPYAVFRYTEPDGTIKLFQYQRGQGNGEARLRAKRSVGVGGHISTLDVADDHAEADVYRAGLMRELDEEIHINAPHKESCVGMINDDQTEVGKVHLGVVHVFDMERPEVKPREADIQDASFQPLSEIAKDLEAYESWSQIAVRALLG